MIWLVYGWAAVTVFMLAFGIDLLWKGDIGEAEIPELRIRCLKAAVCAILWPLVLPRAVITCIVGYYLVRAQERE